MSEIKQGDKVIIEGTVDAFVSWMKEGRKVRIKVGDQTVWVRPEQIRKAGE